MKILIVSDIHGNYEAWSALPEEYDELWVLWDLVNYGPEPSEVVAEVMEKASLVVQGNHDHAVAHDDDSKWTSRYREMATATRMFTKSAITKEQKAYLRSLPLREQVERDGKRFLLTHATPLNPLYGKCETGADQWSSLLSALPIDVLLVGHTHIPFIRQVGDKVLLNPGSLGQSRAGNPLACYAVWKDGKFELKSFRYPVHSTVEKVRALKMPNNIISELVDILETGTV